MLPHDLHQKYAIEVLSAGKHLFLEKPVARTADEAAPIFQAAAAAAERGVRFYVAENSSYWPEVRATGEHHG